MQLVVVSPLVRALETAAGIFGVDAEEAQQAAQQAAQAAQQQQQGGDSGEGAEGAVAMEADAAPLLMLAQAGAGGWGRRACTAHALRSCTSAQLPAPLLTRSWPGPLASPASSLQGKERNARAAHGAVAARPGVRFVAVELCRERLGARLF